MQILAMISRNREVFMQLNTGRTYRLAPLPGWGGFITVECDQCGYQMGPDGWEEACTSFEDALAAVRDHETYDHQAVAA